MSPARRLESVQNIGNFALLTKINTARTLIIEQRILVTRSVIRVGRH
jgi:hypothetical protein